VRAARSFIEASLRRDNAGRRGGGYKEHFSPQEERQPALGTQEHGDAGSREKGYVPLAKAAATRGEVPLFRVTLATRPPLPLPLALGRVYIWATVPGGGGYMSM